MRKFAFKPFFFTVFLSEEIKFFILKMLITYAILNVIIFTILFILYIIGEK